MIRLVDPFGFIAGTWNWMGSHGGGGFAALLAVLVVMVLHLAVLAAAAIVLRHPLRFVEALRGFLQGVREDAPNDGTRV
jgi:hypothetical protein